MAQVARDLDVHENELREWVRDHDADPISAFPGHDVLQHEQQKIERLRRELARMDEFLSARSPESNRDELHTLSKFKYANSTIKIFLTAQVGRGNASELGRDPTTTMLNCA